MNICTNSHRSFQFQQHWLLPNYLKYFVNHQMNLFQVQFNVCARILSLNTKQLAYKLVYIKLFHFILLFHRFFMTDSIGLRCFLLYSVRNTAHFTIGTFLTLCLHFLLLFLIIAIVVDFLFLGVLWRFWCFFDAVISFCGTSRSHLDVHIFYLLW